MADPKLELREVTDGFRTLTRRLQLREQQLTDLARQLRRAAGHPTFEAPVGDRSRRFVDAQARRLEVLATRLHELRLRLDRVNGSLRPHPEVLSLAHLDPAFKGGSAALDWSAADVGIREVIARCPSPHHGEWESTGPDDDPELVDRPSTRPHPVGNAHGPAWFKPLPPVRPLERTWRLDLTAIRQMTKQLRTLGERVDELGQACRRDFDDPSGRMPHSLREAIDRAGVSTARVCGDVERRLRRHAAAVDRKMATPGLLGPGPQYGLSAFGIDQKLVGLDFDVEAAFVALRDAGDEWHDRVRELTVIMEWLCRRLPVVFGTPAQAFFDLVAITDTSPPLDRPPGSLPPIRYPVPPDLQDGDQTVVDPATSLSMTRAEYYQRYGVRFGSPLPQPLLPLPSDSDGSTNGSSSTGSTAHDATVVDALAAGALVGGVTGAATRPLGRGRGRSRDAEAEADDAGDRFDADARDLGGGGRRVGRSTAADGDTSSRDDADGSDPDVDRNIPTDAAARRDPTRAGDAATTPIGNGAPADAAPGNELPAGAATSVSSATPAADPQLAADVAVAVRRGGVRVTSGAGAVLGSVIVGGVTAGAAINKKTAAKKITNWMQYKSRRKPGPTSAKADA